MHPERDEVLLPFGKKVIGDAEKSDTANGDSGLLQRFAGGTLLGGLAILEIATGWGPSAVSVDVVATKKKDIIGAPNDNPDSDSRYQCGFVHRMGEPRNNDQGSKPARIERSNIACRRLANGWTVTGAHQRAAARGLFLDNDVFCQGFESLSVRLHHSNRYMASLAAVEVSYSAGFALMRPTDDFALRTVFESAWLFGFHFYCSIVRNVA